MAKGSQGRPGSIPMSWPSVGCVLPLLLPVPYPSRNERGVFRYVKDLVFHGSSQWQTPTPKNVSKKLRQSPEPSRQASLVTHSLVSCASLCMISRIDLQAAEAPSGVERMVMGFSAAPVFSLRWTSILMAGTEEKTEQSVHTDDQESSIANCKCVCAHIHTYTHTN